VEEYVGFALTGVSWWRKRTKKVRQNLTIFLTIGYIWIRMMVLNHLNPHNERREP
jgi:hypothetical protein